MKTFLTLISFGGVVGAYLSALICDLLLERKLSQHGDGKKPIILKAGSNEYTVKVTDIEYFGPVRSDGD